MRKYIVLAAMCLLFAIAACNIKITEKTESAEPTSMFVEVENGPTWKIVYHKQTKVMYSVSDGAYTRGTFTVLLDADGKPMTYRP